MLSDGMPHSRDEMMTCLADDMASRSALRVAIAQVRGKIRPLGQDIVCRLHFQNKIFYQHVRMLNSQ